MLDVNLIKKDVLRSKAIAKFQRYDFETRSLIYNIQLTDGLYQFPVKLLRPFEITNKISEKGMKITLTIEGIEELEDIKGADFFNEMKGALLSRWIEKAVKDENFICLTQKQEVVI